MNKSSLLLIFTTLLSLNIEAQTWDDNDDYRDNNWNRGQQQNRGRAHQQGGWNQGNRDWDNPYQDPNYYPNHNGHRSCPPPPPPACRTNVVYVAPPPSFCAPVVITLRPALCYRPVGYRFRYHRGYGYGHRHWRHW